MKHQSSIWTNTSEFQNYPALKKNTSADVVIIGAGITGISTALLLGQTGLNVLVLESLKVGGGATAHSTGNLYFTIDRILSSLKSRYDTKTVRKVADSRLAAMNQIGEWVEQFSLDCDYREVPWILYSDYEDGCNKIEEEFETGTMAELPFLKAGSGEVPFPHREAIKLLHQKQMNPMKYVQQLAKAALRQNCKIFENTAVRSVEREKDRFILKTDQAEISARYVVHATHTPKGVKLVQTLLGPYREYGIACRLKVQQGDEGIFWGYHEEGKKISTRTYSNGGDHYLIVVGEPHKTGQASDNKRHILYLEDFAARFFDVQDTIYRWGGQHYRPADLLPYIGAGNSGSGEFIATGFSTDGLVYGTLAAMIIADEITGRKNEWAEVYDAGRIQPLKAAPEFIKENMNVAVQMVKDYAGLTLGSIKSELKDLKSGEGTIIKHEGKKLAVYRNDDNSFEALSAVCPHMKCIVHWNNAEQSWDCPCHGSRFQTDGTVLEGPAFSPLEKIDL
jgi:glycine/D-amino acid oxidase-like deaminating enzyme/nitrite reductase/ring-hydroxylating ferredoxin subunit